jgi:hypothetical protein
MLSPQNENAFSPSHTSGTAPVTLPGPVGPKPVTLPGPVPSRTSGTTLNISGVGPSDALPPELNPADGAEAAATLPDLDSPDSWPEESERNPADANDPANWPDAGDPSGALNEANDRAAAILRAATDAIEGKSAPPHSRRDDWSWEEAREGGLVCAEEQRMSAVYTNPNGHVVIRQADPFDDDDPYLVFTPANIPVLIRALANEVGLEVSITRAASGGVATSPEVSRQGQSTRRSSKPKDARL